MLYLQANTIISGAIDVYCLLIIVWAVLSFFPRMDHRHPLVQLLEKLTAPVLGPLRRMLPQVGGMDFSPLLAIFLLRTVQQLIGMLLGSLAAAGA